MNAHEIFNIEFERLISEAKSKDEFEFINILLGYKGMGEIMALTHFYESESLFSDFQKILPDDPSNKNYVRLGLFLYCHFYEMNELYRIIGNLLNVVIGKRFEPFLFESFDDNQLYPVDKVNELKKIADECKFQDLISSLASLYQNRLRNSFFHSNYSIDGDEYIITSKHPIVINGTSEFSLSIKNYLHPLILSTLNIANTFFEGIKRCKSSYQSNKIIEGRFPDWQPILILGGKEEGLIGFQSLTNGGAVKITKFGEKPFLAAFNLTVNVPNKEVNSLSKQIDEIISKNVYAKDDPILEALSQKITANGSPVLVKSLATPYYNWGNNLVSIAQKSENPYQQKQLLRVAIQKYKLALHYNAAFAQAIHNIVLTEIELSNVDSTFTLSKVAAFKEIEKSVLIDKNFSEGFSNVGLVAFNAGKELNGSPEAKEFFLKAAYYYGLSSEKKPEDCNAIYSVAICFHEASLVDNQREEKLENANLAFQKYKEAIACNKNDLSFIFAFSSFSEYYVEIKQEGATELLTEAIKLLDIAEELVPDNAEIYYKKGNKYLLIGLYSDDKETNFLKAIGLYEKAISLNSSHEKTLNNLGWSLVKLGQLYNNDKSIDLYTKAIAELDKALVLYPNKAESYLNEGEAYLELYRLLNTPKFKNLSTECFIRANDLQAGLATDLLGQLKSLPSS